MSATGLNALQEAVYDALVADTALMAIATGVYDRVPEGTALPYIVFAQTMLQDASNATENAMRIRMRLEVFSRSGGRKQVMEMSDRIHAVLHHQTFLLAGGFRLVWLRLETLQVGLQRDGMTWQASIQLSACVE